MQRRDLLNRNSTVVIKCSVYSQLQSVSDCCTVDTHICMYTCEFFFETLNSDLFGACWFLTISDGTVRKMKPSVISRKMAWGSGIHPEAQKYALLSPFLHIFSITVWSVSSRLVIMKCCWDYCLVKAPANLVRCSWAVKPSSLCNKCS